MFSDCRTCIPVITEGLCGRQWEIFLQDLTSTEERLLLAAPGHRRPQPICPVGHVYPHSTLLCCFTFYTGSSNHKCGAFRRFTFTFTFFTKVKRTHQTEHCQTRNYLLIRIMRMLWIGTIKILALNAVLDSFLSSQMILMCQLKFKSKKLILNCISKQVFDTFLCVFSW